MDGHAFRLMDCTAVMDKKNRGGGYKAFACLELNLIKDIYVYRSFQNKDTVVETILIILCKFLFSPSNIIFF